MPIIFTKNITYSDAKNSDKKRNLALDLARVICAYGVIVTHVPASTVGAKYFQLFFHNFHVPFFYLAAIAFFTLKMSRPTGDIAARIFKRLIIPYLIWNVFYSFLLYINGSLKMENLWDALRILFYGESAVHLYFVPQLAMMQLMALSIFKLYKRTETMFNLGILIITGLYFIVGEEFNCFGHTSFLNLLFYLIVGYAIRNILLRKPNHNYYLIGGMLLMAITIYITYIEIDNWFLHLPLGGTAIVLICSSLSISPSGKHQLLLNVAASSFGIYLIHIIILESIQLAAPKFGVDLENSLVINIVLSLSILALSYLSVQVLSKSSKLSRLLFGNVK